MAGRSSSGCSGPAPAAAGGVVLLGSRPHRAGHGTIQPRAERAMIVGMRKAQDPGPGSRVDNPQDGEVTGDLPMSLTTFVGRERELDELRSLFREGKRLVTLVGIGGIGKTRLALELGFSASDLGWASVYLVELASLANPGLVDGAVLESVGGVSSCSPLQAAS